MFVTVGERTLALKHASRHSVYDFYDPKELAELEGEGTS
jgi:hypothetical protein